MKLLNAALLLTIYASCLYAENPSEQTERGLVTWSAGDSYAMAPFLVTQSDVDNTAATVMKTISTGGRYYLSGNMTINPQNNGITCIKITASNVTLDFRGHTLTSNSSGGATGVTAVEVDSSLSNVKIINGVISAIRGTGIKVNSSCTGIELCNMFVDNCSLMGIDVQSSCTNIKVKDCTVTNCDGSDPSATDGAVGLKISASKILRLEDSHFDLNEHAGNGNAIGVYISGCTHVNIERCTAHSNKSGAASGAGYGFRFDVAGGHIHCHECEANHNTSQSGAAYGFSVEGYATGGEFFDCMADGNNATGGDSHGFSFSGGTHNIIIKKTHAHGNTGNNNVYGFKFSSSDYNSVFEGLALNQNTTGTTTNSYGFYSTGGTGNVFLECESSGNKGGSDSTAIGAGFCLAGSEQYSNILRSDARVNDGNGGSGYGIYLTTATRCTIRGNTLFNNIGATNGYGIKDDATASVSAYMENFAYGNGNSAGSTLNNYDVKLSPNDTVDVFPVREAFITDYTNLKNINFLDNIELIEKTDVTALR